MKTKERQKKTSSSIANSLTYYRRRRHYYYYWIGAIRSTRIKCNIASSTRRTRRSSWFLPKIRKMRGTDLTGFAIFW